MTLFGYVIDAQVLAGLMLTAALMLLWIGLRRPAPAPEADRPVTAPVDPDADRRPPPAEAPRGPWG